MVVLYSILVATLYTRSVLGGPMHGYRNASIVGSTMPAEIEASLQAAEALKTSSNLPSLTSLPSTSSTMPARAVHHGGVDTSCDLGSSMTTSSYPTASTHLEGTARKGHTKYNATTTQATTHARSMLGTESRALGAHSKAQASGSGAVHGSQYATGGMSSGTTTTLTLFTTIHPHAQTNGSPGALGSNAASGFSGIPSSYGASSWTGGRGIQVTSSSIPGASSTNVKTTKHETTSLPPVWGTLTLTYSETSTGATGSVSHVSSTTHKTRKNPHQTTKTRHRRPTKAHPTQVHSSSAIYPYPSSSKQGSDTSATANPIHTSSSAPTFSFSYDPQPTQSSRGLPPLVTQQSSSSNPPPTSTSSTIAGITIVPVNPSLTTIYITTTTTDAGITTTVAQQTATVNG